MICYRCQFDKPQVDFIVCEEAGAKRISRLCQVCRDAKTAQTRIVPMFITCSTCRIEKHKKEFRVDGAKERYVSVCHQCKADKSATQRYQQRKDGTARDVSRLQQILSCNWTTEEMTYAQTDQTEKTTSSDS